MQNVDICQFFWVVQSILVTKKLEEHTFFSEKWLKRIFILRFFWIFLEFFWFFSLKIEEKTRFFWWFCMKTSSYWWKWCILVLNLCFNGWNPTLKKWTFAVKCHLECTLCLILSIMNFHSPCASHSGCKNFHYSLRASVSKSHYMLSSGWWNTPFQGGED